MGEAGQGGDSEEVFISNSSDGGKIGAETGVKLAYKTVSAPVFISDGHPMLLDRILVKKISRQNYDRQLKNRIG